MTQIISEDMAVAHLLLLGYFLSAWRERDVLRSEDDSYHQLVLLLGLEVKTTHGWKKPCKLKEATGVSGDFVAFLEEDKRCWLLLP